MEASRAVIADRDKSLQQHLATIQSLEQRLDASRTLVQEMEVAQQKLSEAVKSLQGDIAVLYEQKEQQRADLQSRIDRRETHIRDLEKKFFYRALVRLKLLPPPFISEHEADSAEKKIP